MQVIFPPNLLRGVRPWLFLAGSIEQGVAAPRQDIVADRLSLTEGTLLNPRRTEWDNSWRQSIDEPSFREQVEWELEAMERADLIAVYFDPSTKSPITLLELGLFARSGKLVAVEYLAIAQPIRNVYITSRHYVERAERGIQGARGHRR